jgi:hypothetical protein
MRTRLEDARTVAEWAQIAKRDLADELRRHESPETGDRRAELGEAAAALLAGEVRGLKLWALDLDALTVSVRDGTGEVRTVRPCPVEGWWLETGEREAGRGGCDLVRMLKGGA